VLGCRTQLGEEKSEGESKVETRRGSAIGIEMGRTMEQEGVGKEQAGAAIKEVETEEA
jgi:hypothetical protein